MIVRNEEKTLERLLTCAQGFCDELIVVDTGSTDSTVAIAERLGAKVFHFAWIDDFAAARNFAFDQASGDWIIWLDADDVVAPPTQAAMRRLKKNTLKTSAIDLIYATYQVDFDAQGQVLNSYLRERLIRRRANLRWVQPVHEYIEITEATGRIVRADLLVEHRPLPENLPRKQGRNLRIYEAALRQKTLDLATCSPHAVYQYAKELQGNDRPNDAIEQFRYYLQRTADRPDHVGEQYNATVMLADLLRLRGELDAALVLCDNAIARNPARAEALTQAGLLLFEQQQWARALPYFRAAALLSPPTTGQEIFFGLYGALPRRYVDECERRLLQGSPVS